MTFKEAFNIAKKLEAEKQCIEALEFDDFFAFAFGSKKMQIGSGYITVDKKSGKIGSFCPTIDFDSYMKAKALEI